MNMPEFKALPIEEQLTRLNKHLLMIKDLPGRLEDNFKSGDFEFSYSLLKKDAPKLGITVDGKNYVAFKTGEEPQQNDVKKQQETKKKIVKTKQNDVKNNNLVKQNQQIVTEETLELTTEEILFVKELFKNKQDLVKTKQTLFLPQFVGAKKTTGISVYVELWGRWNEFKKQYPMYSGTDLMALALEEFMEKYDESSDS